jgi:outer membrane protein assembly factor BamB
MKLLSCLVAAGMALMLAGGCRDAATAAPHVVEKTISRSIADIEISNASHDWPNFLGPMHNGQSAERQLNLAWSGAGPKELWRKKLGTGYSSPVVVGERLIIQHRVGDEEIVECFARDSGESQWQHKYATSYQCPYHYSSGPYSTPCIDGDRVFAFAAEGTLRAIDLATGELKWERTLNADYAAELGEFPVCSSPLVDGERLIVHVGGGEKDAGIVALDKQTGATLWNANRDGASDASPIVAEIAGERFVVALTNENVAILEADHGKVQTEIAFAPKNRQMWNNATTPVIDGDLAFVSMFGAGTMCWRLEPNGQHTQLWREFRSLNCQFHNLIARHGHVYGYAGSEDALWCVEMATSDVKWKWPAEKGRGVSLAVDDKLVTLFEDGYLGVLQVSPAKCEQLCITDKPVLPKKCVSFPALCDGRLMLRNDTEVVCYDLRP